MLKLSTLGARVALVPADSAADAADEHLQTRHYPYDGACDYYGGGGDTRTLLVFRDEFYFS